MGQACLKGRAESCLPRSPVHHRSRKRSRRKPAPPATSDSSVPRATVTVRSMADTWRGSHGVRGSCSRGRRRHRWADRPGPWHRSPTLRGPPPPPGSDDAWRGRRSGRRDACGRRRLRRLRPGTRLLYSPLSGRRRPDRHHPDMRRARTRPPGRRHPDTPLVHDRRPHGGPGGHRGRRSWRERGDR